MSIKASCARPCGSYTGECKTLHNSQYQPIGHECVRTICDQTKAANEDYDSQEDIDSEIQLGYDFRDNFLSNYSIGVEYIDYYYTFSNTYSNYYSQEQWEKIKSIRYMLLSKASDLMFGLDESKILFNESDKQIMIDLVNSLQPLDDSIDFQNMISNIYSDIERFSNKSIQEVKTLLN